MNRNCIGRLRGGRQRLRGHRNRATSNLLTIDVANLANEDLDISIGTNIDDFTAGHGVPRASSAMRPLEVEVTAIEALSRINREATDLRHSMVTSRCRGEGTHIRIERRGEDLEGDFFGF